MEFAVASVTLSSDSDQLQQAIGPFASLCVALPEVSETPINYYPLPKQLVFFSVILVLCFGKSASGQRFSNPNTNLVILRYSGKI